jgi:hypothetical protein
MLCGALGDTSHVHRVMCARAGRALGIVHSTSGALLNVFSSTRKMLSVRGSFLHWWLSHVVESIGTASDHGAYNKSIQMHSRHPIRILSFVKRRIRIGNEAAQKSYTMARKG